MKLFEFIAEAPNKTAVIAWGRMNPPTIGHQQVVDTVNNTAKKLGADPILFLTKTQNPKKDPLNFSEKFHFASNMFNIPIDKNANTKTLIQAFQELQSNGYENVVLVAGSDRIPEYQKLLDTYNNKPDKKGIVPFAFKNIKVVSSGDRDPDAEGVSGMSASKLRQLAVDGNFDAFKSGVPGDETLAKQMYARVRSAMGIQEEGIAENPRGPQQFNKKLDHNQISQLIDDFIDKLKPLLAPIIPVFSKTHNIIKDTIKQYVDQNPMMAKMGIRYANGNNPNWLVRKIIANGIPAEHKPTLDKVMALWKGLPNQVRHEVEVNPTKFLESASNEMFGFATKRPKPVTIKKKPKKDDYEDSLGQRVQDRLKQIRKDQGTVKEEGVGIVTKQNATKDVPVGGEYMNLKKLHLGKKPKNLMKNR